MGSDNFDIPNRSNWRFGKELGCGNPFEDKTIIIRSYIGYMVRRVSQMFEWKGLPETIPQRELERLLQLNGFAVIDNVPNPKRGESGLYAFYAGLGGMANAYQKPTIANINNPYLNFVHTGAELNKDVALVLNDMNYEGLYDMYAKYANLLAEIDVTMRVLSVNSRAPFVLYAENDDMKLTLDGYIKDLEAGKISYVIGKRLKNLQEKLPPSIETKPYSSQSAGELIKSLIELKQYVKASWFNELGIQDAFNMKREALSTEEINLTDDTLMPLIDEMLNMRQLSAEIINKIFGTQISVDFSSVWKERREENELLKEKMEAEAEITKQPDEQTQKEPEEPKKEEETKND